MRTTPTVCCLCGTSDAGFYANTGAWCKRCVKARRLARYQANRDTERAAMSAYGKATRPQRTAAERRWERENAERVRIGKRIRKDRRRAREAAAFVEDVDPQVVWERDEGVCAICGRPAGHGNWHLDHVIPLSAGGEHSYANTQVSHPLCNLRKGADHEVRERVPVA